LTDGLPAGTAGVVVPGGFPEEHAEQLASNELLLADIRRTASAHMPIHAECAGLLYLSRSLDGHAMAGVLGVDARFSTSLTLGYRDAVALHDSVLFPAGARVTGHEFHRTMLVDVVNEHPTPAWGWRNPNRMAEKNVVREGFVHGNVHASYLHTHPAGNSESVASFVGACAQFASRD
jgi:cobyrinic acid a,c-diamide synthase